MSLARCRSVVLLGVDARRVDVEVHLGGLPGFSLVGLPDTSVSEARDRVRAAVLSSGESWPQQRITANLSPASLPKHGTHFDLALALAVLAAAGSIPLGPTDDLVVMGELSLDGRVRPVPECYRPSWQPRPTACGASWSRQTTCPRREWSTTSRCSAPPVCGRW